MSASYLISIYCVFTPNVVNNFLILLKNRLTIHQIMLSFTRTNKMTTIYREDTQPRQAGQGAAMLIGKQVKELRKARNMSLSELAKASGVQIATLSRIENLKMIGTLESHMNIARALGIDITHLYQNMAAKSASPAKREQEDQTTETFSYNDRASYEILTSSLLSKKMMPIVLKIEPGGKTNAEQGPAGAEKFIFVLEGLVQAYLGEKTTYSLSKHNTLYFDASVKHYFVNSGKNIARVISVMTPVSL